MKVSIIDTGCANLSSVKFALSRLGYNPIISDDLDELGSADKLLLPGVGTASFAMSNLTKKNLTAFIKNTQTPLLGICLGMQLLTLSSQEGEGGDVATLGVIPVHTKKLSTASLPLPHMGWNSLDIVKDSPLFDGIKSGDFVYFVHSFGVAVNETTLATCDYDEAFSAIVNQDNFYGMQFHPEKSGKVGARLLQNFIENI